MLLSRRFLSALLFAGVVLSTHSVDAQQEQELEDIQRQIKQRQQSIERQLDSARSLEAELKQAELEIAESAKALNQTQIKLENNRFERRDLEKKQQGLVRQQKTQQQLLAKQLRSAYIAGNYDYVKMLFNQEDAAKFERMLSYYQYLNEARKTEIEGYKALVVELNSVNQQLLESRNELQALENAQKQQRRRLGDQQVKRQATLARLERQIDSDAAKVEQLQISEQALLKAIEEAARSAQSQQDVSLSGLASLKGQLRKPTRGQLRRLYGKRRQGQVRWKGVVINGNVGSPVRAVHDGKVLYADWLRGFGLVTVLDHGQGYMSLYGHNQALMKQAGELVSSGETIALVGQSGGQTSPNLYFEIRHKGKPVNPSQWLQR